MSHLEGARRGTRPTLLLLPALDAFSAAADGVEVAPGATTVSATQPVWGRSMMLANAHLDAVAGQIKKNVTTVNI